MHACVRVCACVALLLAKAQMQRFGYTDYHNKEKNYMLHSLLGVFTFALNLFCGAYVRAQLSALKQQQVVPQSAIPPAVA